MELKFVCPLVDARYHQLERFGFAFFDKKSLLKLERFQDQIAVSKQTPSREERQVDINRTR